VWATIERQPKPDNNMENPQDRMNAVHAWIQANRDTNHFAASLAAAKRRFGALTPRQIEAVERNLAPKVTANVAGEGFALLMRAFRHARITGLKYPKVHVGALRFSMAQDDSKNPGYLYIKAHGDYAGKISPEGEFQAARTATAKQCERIASVARDPLAAAVAHGHATGNCAVCSRPLSDAESVTRGIGPVCAKRFGWI
jgi:hypothetical protein